VAVDPGEIAQVRAATDIVALISEQVALKKSGRRWTGLCPFHGEKTPSFFVNAELGVYNCFGCGASGDAITFVRETQHLDFRDALQLLADKSGIELHDTAQSGPQRQERQDLLAAMERAVDWYHRRLLDAPDAGPARQYLRSRGIDGDTVRQFRLGWAPDAWDALASGLDLPVRVLSGSGLGFENSVGRRQDFLRARVVFPIFDTSGRAIAVGGRVLPTGAGSPRPDGRIEPKYKNSQETAIYSKRRTLYGLHLAKDDVIRSGEIIVCEGYTDVIGLFGAGLPRAVATCGTALTEDHFRTMRNFARRIVLAYDADAAGQNAAASVYQWERQHEVEVAVVRLPGGTDPGELAQTNPEALRTAVAEAVPYLEFRIERALERSNLTTVEGRARAAEDAMALVAEHPADIVRDQYLVTVADRCRVDADRLRPLLARARSGQVRPARSSDAVAPRVVTTTSRPGRAALALVIHLPESVDGRFEPAYFTDPTQRVAFEALKDGALINEAVDFLDRREELAASQLIQEIAVEEVDDTLASDREIAAVTAQLIRLACTEALKDVDRDMRGGLVTPESALGVIKDVKLRLEELDGPSSFEAEGDLRAWLVEHDTRRAA
jgi:DNA primase